MNGSAHILSGLGFNVSGANYVNAHHLSAMGLGERYVNDQHVSALGFSMNVGKPNERRQRSGGRSAAAAAGAGVRMADVGGFLMCAPRAWVRCASNLI